MRIIPLKTATAETSWKTDFSLTADPIFTVQYIYVHVSYDNHNAQNDGHRVQPLNKLSP